MRRLIHCQVLVLRVSRSLLDFRTANWTVVLAGALLRGELDWLRPERAQECDIENNLQAVRFELTTSFRIGGYSSGVSATHPHLHGAIGQNRTDFPPPSTACVDHNHHNGIHGGDGTDSNLQAFRRTCFQDRLLSNSDHPRIRSR